MTEILELFGYKGFLLVSLIVTATGVLTSTVRAGFKYKTIALMLFFGAFSFLLGSRFLYLLTSDIPLSVSTLFDTSLTGFSLFGGMFLSCLACLTLGSRLKINTLKLADLAVVWLGIGIAIMRLGCFIRGCCYGKETDMPWGVSFKLFGLAHMHQLSTESGDLFIVHPVHPTQLYELGAALSASILSYIVQTKGAKPGIAAGSFVIWFTFLRLVIHFFREIPETYTGNQYLYPLAYTGIMSFVSYYLVKINGTYK